MKLKVFLGVCAIVLSSITAIAQEQPKMSPEEKAQMDAMMKDHLDRTTEEVVARLHSDWTGDVAAYDKVHNQVLGMADMLSDGIIANFPAKFRP